MSVLTQGTHVFVIDESGQTPAVLRIRRATTFNPGGDPADQIEDTALEDFERQYKSGLRTPGQATMGLNADPKIDSHVKLYDFSRENPAPTLKWAIGWADGDAPPAVGNVVGSVTIDAAGSGYTNPTVEFGDPDHPDGKKAEGVAVVSGGAITGITITDPGSGYDSAPTVTISDSGSGNGATATASLGGADFVLPDTRTWFTYQGYISDFPFDFTQNSVVSSELTIQRSGGSRWVKKAQS